MPRALVLSVALALPATAHAYVWIGNPKVHVQVDRPAGDITSAVADVGALRVHKCGGGFDLYSVSATVDLSTPLEQTVSGGDICGVSLTWSSSLEIDSAAWSLSYDESWTPVAISGPDVESVALTPFEVVSGRFTGGAPRLYVWID